jgi:hypothetical protein
LRRINAVLALTLVSGLSLAGSASAASQTVKGTGDIEKMAVNNAQKELKVNLYGFDPPCEAKYMKIIVTWGKKAAYEIDNGCYPGGEWMKSLVYVPNKNKPDGHKLLKCSKLKFKYVKSDGSYRAVVPRSCMPKAADKVKVSSWGNNFSSTTGGEAGPTRSLRRG